MSLSCDVLINEFFGQNSRKQASGKNMSSNLVKKITKLNLILSSNIFHGATARHNAGTIKSLVQIRSPAHTHRANIWEPRTISLTGITKKEYLHGSALNYFCSAVALWHSIDPLGKLQIKTLSPSSFTYTKENCVCVQTWDNLYKYCMRSRGLS